MYRHTKIKTNIFSAMIFILLINVMSLHGNANLETTPQKTIIQYQAAEDLYEKGLSQVKIGNIDKAMKYFDRSIQKFELFTDSYFARSMIYYQKEKWNHALENITQSKEKYPVLFKMNKGLQKKKLETLIIEEETIVKALIEHYSDPRKDCRYGVALNRLLERKERVKKMIADLSNDSGLNEISTPPRYDFLHGNILIKLNKLDQAKEQYQRTILSDPTHNLAYNNLASIYYQQEQFHDALDVIWQAESNGAEVNAALKNSIIKKMQINDLKETTGSSGLLKVKKFRVNVGDEQDVFFENIYLLYHSEKRDAVIIDPGKPSKEVSDFIADKSLKVVFILNTHGHYDHTGANGYFSDLYKVPVVAHIDEKKMLSGKGYDKYRIHFFENENEYTINDMTFNIFLIPGHTAGSVCYQFDDLLFTGDILFYDSIGKINMSSTNQSEEQMIRNVSKEILRVLGHLSPDTKIFPGHGISTSWKRELVMNPFISEPRSQ